MKQKHTKIKINLNFQLLYYSVKFSLDTDLSLVIRAGNLSMVALHKCNSSRDKNKTSGRQPSLPDRELKLHQIHTSIKTQTSNFCHIWYWNILHCAYFLTVVTKFAHFDNKDFPPVFDENLCVWIFVDAFPVYNNPK